MKSRVLIIITTVLLFGVGIAVYAYNSNQTTTNTIAASCCCCSGDSCPMKSADTKATAEASHDCCCKGGAESCPMMKDGKAHVMHKDLMGSDDKTHEIHKSMAASAEGKSGCSCACCAHSKEKKDAPAI